MGGISCSSVNITHGFFSGLTLHRRSTPRLHLVSITQVSLVPKEGHQEKVIVLPTPATYSNQQGEGGDLTAPDGEDVPHIRTFSKKVQYVERQGSDQTALYPGSPSGFLVVQCPLCAQQTTPLLLVR